MKIHNQGETLRVSGVKELGAANSNAFRDWVRSNLAQGHRNIEIDLSETTFLDSCGLGALISLHKLAQSRQGTVRLLSPQPQVDQILSLTRMHYIFDIVRSQPAQQAATPTASTAAVPATA
jgi:anti-sigma B factor antagonist